MVIIIISCVKGSNQTLNDGTSGDHPAISNVIPWLLLVEISYCYHLSIPASILVLSVIKPVSIKQIEIYLTFRDWLDILETLYVGKAF